MLYQTLSKKSPVISFFFVGSICICSVIGRILFGDQENFFEQLFNLVLQHTCIILVAASGNYIMTRQKIVGVGDYNVLVTTTLALLCLSISSENTSLLLGILIAMILVHRFGKLFNQHEGAIEEFEIGVLSGIATLISPVFILLVVYSLVVLNQTKSNRGRDYFAVILGFLFVFTLKILMQFFADQTISFFPYNDLQLTLPTLPKLAWNKVLGIALLLSWYSYHAFKYFAKSDQLSIRLRVFFRTIILIFPAIVAGYLISQEQISIFNFLVLCSPLFIFLSQLTAGKSTKGWKNNIPVLLFLSILLTLVLG